MFDECCRSEIHTTRRGFEVQYQLMKYIMHVRSKRDDISQGMNILPIEPVNVITELL